MNNEMKKPKDDPFKDYVPEVVEYDPEVDGEMREEILSEKEKLKERITKLKEKNRGDRKVRR